LLRFMCNDERQRMVGHIQNPIHLNTNLKGASHGLL